MYKLRDYQARVKRELYDWFAKHPKGFPIVDACVGAGKSIIIADLCQDMISQAPDTRIVMCVASRELCEQNMQKLLAIWPDAPAGICSAALGSKDTDSQIIFATIGTLSRRVDELGTVDVMIIDECHNINTANTGMYRKMIETLQDTTSPNMAVIGFTGTPYRGNGVWLWQGKNPIFEGVASRVTMDELLKLGYLAPLVVEPMQAKIDTTGVKITAGDYNNAELARVLEDEELVRSCIDDLYIRSHGRHKWLIFCHSIAQAEMVLAQVRTIGDITAEMVIGDTPSDSREKILKAYKLPHDHDDAVNVLVNVGVLTTGFDAPMTDLIALLRPTKSPVLYVQIAGRGMRIADGKTDCLWLDYTSTTYEQGPVNQVRGRNSGQQSTTANGEPCKHCPECGEKNPLYASECLECGASFGYAKDKDIAQKAGHAQVLADEAPIWMRVDALSYTKHISRKSGNATLRVDYFTDYDAVPISEYVCIEHEGYAYDKACQWWRAHNLGPVPTCIDDALHLLHTSTLNRPAKIECKRDGKFWKVVGREFGEVNEIYSKPPKSVADDIPF